MKGNSFKNITDTKFFRSRFVRNFLLVALILFFSVLLTGFIFRGNIAKAYLKEKINSFNKKYPASLTFRDLKMRGLSSVLIRGISLKPFEGDTLITIDSVSVSVNFPSLLVGSIEVEDLSVNDALLRLSRRDSLTNYMFLLEGRKDGEVPADTTGESNYAGMISKMFNLAFSRLPHSMNLSKCRLLVKNNDHKTGFFIDRMTMREHYLKGPVRIVEGERFDTMMLSAFIDKHQMKAGFMLYSNRYEKVAFPFTSYRWNTGVEFDTLSFSITGNKISDELMNVHGYAHLAGLVLNNEKIAEDEIQFDRLGINYSFNFGRNYAEMDSSTTITFNRMDFHPYIRYKPHPTKQLTFSIHKPDFPAQDLFSSLPSGLFSSLDGMKVKGSLSWNLDFFVDLSKPDSLIFNSEMKRKGFGIISYGKTPLSRINEPFLYTAYERGQAVRSFMVGPVNSEYRTIDRISPYLKIAVLTGEDPSFYQHAGFLMDAFRESIATNIKQKRFARGGSTITMQMVKNVFLNRNKTIGRKVEEMLITWLIETQHIATKDRIFEVYLNIIEWGPMVYGANEASRFYFNKDASKLNLAEAVFLASLVPHPKWWRSSFTPEGELRPSMAEYYKLVSGKMLRKGQISQHDFDRLEASIELKGAAREMLLNK